MFQESFLRQGVKEFPFPESQLFKTLVANFHHCQNYGEGRCCSKNSTTNSEFRVYVFRVSFIILTDKMINNLINNIDKTRFIFPITHHNAKKIHNFCLHLLNDLCYLIYC